jgi:hypothetical protein
VCVCERERERERVSFISVAVVSGSMNCVTGVLRPNQLLVLCEVRAKFEQKCEHCADSTVYDNQLAVLG